MNHLKFQLKSSCPDIRASSGGREVWSSHVSKHPIWNSKKEGGISDVNCIDVHPPGILGQQMLQILVKFSIHLAKFRWWPIFPTTFYANIGVRPVENKSFISMKNPHSIDYLIQKFPRGWRGRKNVSVLDVTFIIFSYVSNSKTVF